VNRYEYYGRIYFDAHQALCRYLGEWVDTDQGCEMASEACSRWFQAAADVRLAASGPYAELYAAAGWVLTKTLSMGLTASADELVRAIPTSAGTLPYELSWVYNQITKASRLEGWDRKTVHLIAVEISKVWPGSSCSVVTTDNSVLAKPVWHLLRCALEGLSSHQCSSCQICEAAAARWEDDDVATERWLTDQRLKREGQL
jgi:hypothetical protein